MDGTAKNEGFFSVCVYSVVGNVFFKKPVLSQYKENRSFKNLYTDTFHEAWLASLH